VGANSSALGEAASFKPGIWQQECEERLTSKAIHAAIDIDGAGSLDRPQDLRHRAND
jgi:hypothetical protein